MAFYIVVRPRKSLIYNKRRLARHLLSISDMTKTTLVTSCTSSTQMTVPCGRSLRLPRGYHGQTSGVIVGVVLTGQQVVAVPAERVELPSGMYETLYCEPSDLCVVRLPGGREIELARGLLR